MLLKHRAVVQISIVIAGLDPAIHLLTKMMDARVKPAHDDQSERPGFFDLPL